ncbi:hypothetical protein MMC22_010750, partial [Lobaria immixta]|nr:hypothetical protein [Lobaria immixta]
MLSRILIIIHTMEMHHYSTQERLTFTTNRLRMSKSFSYVLMDAENFADQKFIIIPGFRSLQQSPPGCFRLLAFSSKHRSPVASLCYILWNIKVIRKCAMLSDMSTFSLKTLEDVEHARNMQDMQDMLDMRDSLYILSVMNQYTVKSPVDPIDAATLLRISLFADIKTATLDLKARRRKLAVALRKGRKRGIVPVFVSLMWFLFSLAITIEFAFSTLGDNTTAHNLALGLLLAWFPVLILSSIVDRNPTQTAATCAKLNRLLTQVQIALRTDVATRKLIQTILVDNTRNKNNVTNFALNWVDSKASSIKAPPKNPRPPDQSGAATGENGRAEVPDEIGFDQEDPPALASKFFNEFAGQGRLRWHYGVAYPILSGMETIVLDDCKGKTTRNSTRDWLHIPGIQKGLIRGPGKQVSLLHFDRHDFWEIFGAFLIVIGTISGAFVVSFRTPTIGMGCRSGGYVIFGTIAAGIFSLELLTWCFVVKPTKIELTGMGGQTGNESRKPKERLIAKLDWIFRFCELVNTAWLIYIVMAQTVGSYRTCACQAATWGGQGGYINTTDAVYTEGRTVEASWITGVSLSSLIMLTAIAFLVVEWCEQSHLSSVDVNKAMHGLMVTQHFKHRTLWIRRTPGHVFDLSKWLWRTF